MLNVLIYMIVSLLVVGLFLWLVDMLPIAPEIKRLMHTLTVVLCVLWVIFVLISFLRGSPVHISI